MTSSETLQGVDAADKTVPLTLVPKAETVNCDGHPMRRQGLTFVTREVELKGPFGLPHWRTILARVGLMK